MEKVEQFIPPTYPRVQQDMDQRVLLYTSLLLGIISALMVIWTAHRVYANRKKDIIRTAQVDFLAFVLFGSLLTAIGSAVGGFSRNV